ncbi:Tubulin-folding cofactor B [Orchesella cincta]|uniref:Tubulin-folding cofactor B n=1 Tax=Orchesella cincta TaxID=48709 RepID=A0A1D2ML23_ORCCI|nr:Tubulin-folding cofactor B [Orchesella cincta]
MGDEKEFLAVTVTSNLSSLETDRRFPSDVTVGNLKGKLELMTGASMNTMKLELKDKDDQLIYELTDDNLTLSQVHVKSGMKIHVIDSSDNIFDEDNPDAAFKYDEEDYHQRDESMRKFLMKNKLGKFDEEKAKKKLEEEEKEVKLSESIKASDRCEVKVPANPVRRGEVKYVGKVHFKEGIWVGIQYDEPLGKNDGTVEGKRYFECKPKYGGFVRPSNVTVGDFPEVDELDEI